jgi:FixJ family two-component response regulator
MLALNPSVPVIMVTGNGDETVARDALRSGAFDYITKPVDFDRLDEVVSMAVLGPPLAPPSIGSI